jgi:hypothetical protein
MAEQEHGFEYWMEEPTRQAFAEAGSVVQAVTHEVLKKGDEYGAGEGFLHAVYIGALSKANTTVRRIVVGY